MAGMWEYQVVTYHFKGHEEQAEALNAQGAQGWELFQIIGPDYYFKRPKVGAAQANFGR